jgi:hypothetical protein
MTADPLEVRDGLEAAALRLYRMLSPRDQRTFLDAGLRMLDGQPVEDAMTECFVEFGDAPAEARRKVREAINSEPDWRRLLG